MTGAQGVKGHSLALPQRDTTGSLAGLDVFAMIDKLAELRGRNILSAAEFDAKKTELLAAYSKHTEHTLSTRPSHRPALENATTVPPGPPGTHETPPSGGFFVFEILSFTMAVEPAHPHGKSNPENQFRIVQLAPSKMMQRIIVFSGKYHIAKSRM